MKPAIASNLAIAAALLVCALPATATAAPAGKITICHATHSAKNPYVRITISRNGLNGHNGHDDIIPAPAGECGATTSTTTSTTSTTSTTTQSPVQGSTTSTS